MTRYDPVSVIPLFIILVVIAGLVYANISRQRFLNQPLAHQTPNQSPTPTETPTPIPTTSPNPTQIPTVSPLPSATPKASVLAQTSIPPKNTQSASNLDQFRYPQAATITSSSSLIKQESSDTPEKITEWYKAKIQSLGLNTQSFVVTNTNNNVLNSLAAAGNGISIKIEIKKTPSDTKTTITLTPN